MIKKNKHHEKYGSELRFLKNRNTIMQRNVVENMYSDLIHTFGTDMIYYRRSYSFFQKDKDKKTADPIYGADPTSPYTLKANLVVLLENLSDSYLLNRFGIQSEAEIQAYIGIRDFVERFKPILGQEIQRQYSIKVRGKIGCEYVQGILNTPEIYGRVIGRVPKKINEDSATLTGMYFEPIPRPKDLAFKKSLGYDVGKCTASLFSALIDINHKTGEISGYAVGSISHKIGYADNQSSEYELRPQVGDLLVMDNEDDMVQDKYEITRVDKRNQGSNLIYNPLLGNYCYIVTCVQHRDSYEDVKVDNVIQDDPFSVLNRIGSKPEKDELDSDNSGVAQQAQDVQEFADNQYNYSENGNDDNAYGGYGQ